MVHKSMGNKNASRNTTRPSLQLNGGGGSGRECSRLNVADVQEESAVGQLLTMSAVSLTVGIGGGKEDEEQDAASQDNLHELANRP